MPNARGTARGLAALAVLSAALVACSRPTPPSPGNVVPPGPVGTAPSGVDEVPPGPFLEETPPTAGDGSYPPPYVSDPGPTPPYPAPDQTATAEAGGS